MSSSIAKKERPAPAQAEEESGEVLTLPESIYWAFVRPFCEDRVIISKRCSTRYGKRVDIDETLLKIYERRVKVKDADGCWVEGDTTVYQNLPIARGEPGKNNFYIDFGRICIAREDHSATDPCVALEMLRAAREAWDEHLSKIPSPSARLQHSLEILHSLFDENYSPHIKSACPLLFVGNGEIGDVVKFHTELNPKAINGGGGGSVVFFPNTQLGCWVALCVKSFMTQFMRQFFDNGASCSLSSVALESIVRELLDAGADVSPFFEPLEECPNDFSALSFLRCSDLHEPGMSMHHVMLNFLLWQRQLEDHDSALANKVGGVLESLAKKSGIKLRFNVRDWIEASLGCRGWVGGVVANQWVDGYPYRIFLDHGTFVAAPVDSDEYIRHPELRFSVGDRVECQKGEEWVPGTVTKQWPDKGTPTNWTHVVAS